MNNQQFAWISLGLLVASTAVIAQEPTDTKKPSESWFHPAVRLKVNGEILDTGLAWGHSSPCIEDLDGDDLKDLIVGDFSGKFHWYRNVGTSEAPVYEGSGLIQAGGNDAEVRIYCCIGCQARFCDLDGDGIRDMIANSYDPGHCYLFRGQPGNQFAAREELRDKAGIPIRSAPVQEQNYQSFGSFFTPVDWDNDKDYDLLIGCFEGGLKLRINEGTPAKPVFATENIDIEAAGEPLKVKAHLCPAVADWDGDGLWDIVAGSDDGSVTWFKNTGKPGTPKFAAGETLVEAHDGNGYNLALWPDEDIPMGIRSQVEVTDFNGDGKLDLLVGDFYTAYDLRKDLSAKQTQAVRDLLAEAQSIGKEFAKKMEALREEFAKRYPGDKIYSDEADKAWSKAYQALRNSPEAKKMEAQEKVFVNKLKPYLAGTRGTGQRSFDLAKSHGHVWVLIRK